MTQISLRRRLLIILIGLVMLVWLFSVGFAALHSRTVVLSQIDERLQRYADMASYMIATVVSDPEIEAHFSAKASRLGNRPVTMRVASINSSEEQAINLWFGDSQVLLGENAPVFSTPEKAGLLTQYVTQADTAGEWRIIYRHLPSNDVWLAVGVDLQHAQDNGAATFWQIVLPLLVVMPLTALLLIVGVNRGLSPLKQLAESIAARRPHALSPLSADGVPKELHPVVDALNELLARLERALASESRFTANAAHELQTPLSAIKAEVQRCLRIENDAETRDMLKRIDQRVRRSTETVSQLLTLARLDPAQEFSRSRFDLGELLLDVLAEHADAALERELQLEVNIADKVFVSGNAEWIRILLRNLVLNAFKYADIGSEVSLGLFQTPEETPEATTLRISNHCKALPDSVFEQLGNRFYRPEGQRTTGVGLGLSIARRIALLHNASLQVSPKDERGGFCALVRFN